MRDNFSQIANPWTFWVNWEVDGNWKFMNLCMGIVWIVQDRHYCYEVSLAFLESILLRYLYVYDRELGKNSIKIVSCVFSD